MEGLGDVAKLATLQMCWKARVECLHRKALLLLLIQHVVLCMAIALLHLLHGLQSTQRLYPSYADPKH